jgi:hypothetical protein
MDSSFAKISVVWQIRCSEREPTNLLGQRADTEITTTRAPWPTVEEAGERGKRPRHEGTALIQDSTGTNEPLL